MGRQNQDEYEMHTSEKYITSWDRLSSEPGDVYVNGGREWTDIRPDIHDFEEEEGFNEGGLGESYPRGV